MGNNVTSEQSTISNRGDRNCKKNNGGGEKRTANGQPESSRVLFLLYLINRTWNVVVDTVDQKGKRSRSSRTTTSSDSGAPRSHFDDGFDTDFNLTDLDNQSSLYGSQYSFCSCSYCYESKTNDMFGYSTARMSFCESELTYCYGYQMAPSAGKSPPGTQIGPPDMSTEISIGWSANNGKENQRPPVYNAEDYIQSLKKYGRRPNGTVSKSIYDTTEDKLQDTIRSSTLPGKHSEYKSPIPSPPDTDCEMTLRQFGSITDLLTKLRADLRASFPSFVQEFVAGPLDGVSLLLEVLRAIQLSQNGTASGNGSPSTAQTIQRNSQSYQRRALLDELACLQCLSLCCARSPEAGARLGTSPIGLLPLAASATGQSIRSRIIALQLLTTACDKSAFGDGTQRSITSGHAAVSEALSTLRLRCGEPVRFRLLVGMMNSGGGSGELQAFGMKFINTFLESAENTQNRLYLQAELYQAGLEPNGMTKTISSTSPWLEKLRAEVKRWDDGKIDIDRLQQHARDAEKMRSQVVILERRVQIVQEEKTVLTTMERRLQERCAELQREIFRLQGIQNIEYKTASLEKRPIALPRQVPPQSKQSSSEHEDEGISSSETGQSMSPEPPRALPVKPKQQQQQPPQPQQQHKSHDEVTPLVMSPEDDETNTTIDDVIEELQNIVSDAERDLSAKENGSLISVTPIRYETTEVVSNENEIVPVNLLPQPPRKSRSLVHLISNTSEIDDSDYGLLMVPNNNNNQKSMTFFDDTDYEKNKQNSYQNEINCYYSDDDGPDVIHNKNKFPSMPHDTNTNRQILNVIMDAREQEDKLLRQNRPISIERPAVIAPPPQQFNGVFFMNEMSTAQKYPKPDITAALEAKKVSKNLDRMQSYGLDSMIDIVVTSEKAAKNQQVYLASRTASTIPIGCTTTKISTSGQQFKIKTGHCNAGLYSGSHLIRENMRTASNQGSKLTDLPSGLY